LEPWWLKLNENSRAAIQILRRHWADALRGGAGTRRFKIYRQMKMYNAASLNSQLYEKAG